MFMQFLKAKWKPDQWERFVARAAPIGALWCRDEYKRMGYHAPDNCPLCEEKDSLLPRIWYCKHPQAAKARQANAPEWRRREVSNEPLNPRWLRGLSPHPTTKPHYEPQVESGGYILTDPNGKKMDADTYAFN